MSDGQQKDHTNFVLPDSVITKRDVAFLANEIERIDSEIGAAEIRHEDSTPEVFYSAGRFADFVEWNQLALHDSHERSRLVHELRELKQIVPIVHMTFATEADKNSLEELVKWVRGSIDQRAVLDIGLQPSLIAGVYIRTPNRVHDLSLRAMIKNNHGALLKRLEQMHGTV